MVTLTLTLSLASCSVEDNVIKLHAALSSGPLEISVDSSGRFNFNTTIKDFEFSFKPGRGIEAAQNRLGEQRDDKYWYVVLVNEQQEEAVFELAPQGFVRVVLDGEVVQDHWLRLTEIELKPGAEAKITEVFSATSLESIEILVPEVFVGTWRGTWSRLDRREPTRPFTLRIPGREMPREEVEPVPGYAFSRRGYTFGKGESHRIVGSGERPPADYTVRYVSPKTYERPGQYLRYTLAEEEHPPTDGRMYVREWSGDEAGWVPWQVVRLTHTRAGELFVEYVKDSSTHSVFEAVAVLTKDGS